MRTRPEVGSVILLRILSNVDLPAPLRPMMPSTSPCLTSKETSFKAQNSSRVAREDGSWELGVGSSELEDWRLQLADWDCQRFFAHRHGARAASSSVCLNPSPLARWWPMM